MKDKYFEITFKILICVPILFSIFIIDQLLLPQNKINDTIISQSQILIIRRNKFNTSSSKELVGYKFFTKKGHEFSVREILIEENEITIGKSYIFRNINLVKSKNKDYSDKLMSGLNGATFYFATLLVITSVISLFILKFNKNLSENSFQNIVLINFFWAFAALYIYSIGL